MIPADRLAKINHIVSHANCPDGIASVMILKLIWPKAKVTFTNYSTEVIKTMPAEEGMIFCDFSPPDDRIEEFKAAGAIVLDHHKGAKEAVLSFGELGLFADEAAEPGVSGAVLAYRLWKQMASPEMLNSMTSTDLERFSTLVGIRDTWQKESPRWKQACELTSALLFFPLETWDGLHPSEWWDRLFVGERLFEKRLEESKACLDAGFTFTTEIFGRRVILFESLTHTSDAAEMVGDRFDIVAGFGYKAEDGVVKMWYSTRTHTDSIDVLAFCKANGGGGHSRAAGFMHVVTDETPNPYKLFQKLLALYEFNESKYSDAEIAAKATPNGVDTLAMDKNRAIWVAAGCLAGVIGVFILAWIIFANTMAMKRVETQVDHDAFKESAPYTEGMIQELRKTQLEYVKATPDQRKALASVILHQYADFDEARLPDDLKQFLSELKRGQK